MASSAEGSSFSQFGAEKDQFDRAINIAFRQGAIGFSVDDLAATFGVPLPTHVKIDVDGLEADILRGGATVFSSKCVASMIVECEQEMSFERSAEIMGLMTELGFAARPRTSPASRNIVFDRKTS